MQSFGGAPCRALRGLRREPLAELCVEAQVKLSVELLAKLRAELLVKLLVKPLVELCTELPQSSTRSSLKGEHIEDDAKLNFPFLFGTSRYPP